MAVTVLAWNIERFGDRYGFGATGATCDALRMAVIAQVVRDAGAQVLVIQELRSTGLPDLPRLRNALNQTGNNDWHFDWIPGAVDNAAGIPPAALANLDFWQKANYEGYAVLYRQGYVAQIQGALSAGQDTSARAGGGNPNFIDLVYAGQTLAFNYSEPVIRFDLPPPTQNLQLDFPQSISPGANIPARGGKRKVSSSSGASLDTNDTIPQAYETRRPCHVLVVDASSPVQPAPGFPLMVYHAPSKANGAYYGSLIGFASAPLQTGGDRAYAGDLNVVSAPAQAVLNFWAEGLGYTAQTYANDAFALTSVHPSVHTRLWHSGAGVLTAARDYGFGGGACAVDIPPVLDWIQNAGSFTNTFLRGAANGAANRAAVVDTVLPLRADYYPDDAEDAVACYFDGATNYPAGADARTCAALIFHLLLSDHLPVRITR
ncbi:MAG: hypothetical protein JSR45_15145 [Proteobacteria bacterium]|nr:hypothetical protein [Pseudomonadota bacterium]